MSGEPSNILLIRSGKHAGKMLTISKREIVIGRDKACQVQLSSSDVSRRHCAVRPSPEGLWVRDLQSQNGTYVNDAAVEEETLLKAGDVLKIGKMVFQVPHGQKASAQAEKKELDDTSDDDVLSWLADDAGGSSTGTTSTVVIKRNPSDQHDIDAPTPSKPQFESISEEAADIIRRWKEMSGQGAS